ncbi:MAG: tRNA pseudouridine(13) synthase TruD [Gammaproteobacteria bacterium]|nr:tRNA pseudouridine(13) synthase TruD [Gammaproteobacteria bacterium]
MVELPPPFALDWAYAHGEPGCHGTIRTTPEDFQVDERLGYEPDGEGNHVLLHLRKRNTNTEWLARQLAEFAGVEVKEVGYAGLKDRHAVTSQYFTVPLPRHRELDWSQLESSEVTLLAVTRHGKKLQRGGLRENGFTLTLRALHGDCAALEDRLGRIEREGVPNYFGEQRFGRDGNNLQLAEQMFRGVLQERDRHKRGLYLSAARSWLFNRVLSSRVADGSWLQPLPGEALIQPHSRSALSLRVISDEIRARIDQGFLQPSAPLWGRGVSTVLAEAAQREHAALRGEELFMQGLEQAGLEQERRALCLRPKGLAWQRVAADALELRFTLPPGSYATAVLREVVQVTDATHHAWG